MGIEKEYQAERLKDRIDFAAKNGGLFPPFADKIIELVKECAKQNLNVGIHQGFRSFQIQHELYSQGRTKPGAIVTHADAGHSWHNYGLAADIVFKDKNGKWTWEDKLPWSKLGEIGKSLGLTWGGDFKNLKDRPHFQMTGHYKTTLEALERYNKGGLKAVWEAL